MLHIVSGSMHSSAFFANQMGIPRDKFVHVTSVQQILGYDKLKYIVLHTASQNPKWPDILECLSNLKKMGKATDLSDEIWM